MMPNTGLVFVEMDVAMAEAANLISALDGDLTERYPGSPIHGIDPTEFRAGGGIFLIGKLDGVGVTCGAIRPLSERAAELKRMFVRRDQRGQGFGRATLAELEARGQLERVKLIYTISEHSNPTGISLAEDRREHDWVRAKRAHDERRPTNRLQGSVGQRRPRIGRRYTEIQRGEDGGELGGERVADARSNRAHCIGQWAAGNQAWATAL